MINKKGALEFSFTWIFAIIAGMFILFLAIYGVTKFMNISETSKTTQTAVDIGMLTNPLESSFDSSQRSMISTSAETRIYIGCTNNTFFGKQTIKTSEKTYNKWSDTSASVSFPNKYIFANDYVEGKDFYLFSKPFEFPFKVADLIYLTSSKDKYCFIDASRDIEEEIEDLIGGNASETENLFLEDCPSDSINVCFNGGKNCDVEVYATYVEKNGEKMYYEGDALMYAAIFSTKENYECQVSRLMKRISQLSDIYNDKSKFVLQNTGCDSTLDGRLVQLTNLVKNIKGSENIDTISSLSEEIQNINKYLECKLW